MPDELLEGKPAVREDARHIGAEERVREEREDDRDHRQPHDAPCRLDNKQNPDDADDGIRSRDGARARHELAILDDDVRGRGGTEHGKEDVDRVKEIVPRPSPPQRIEQICERKSKAEMHRALKLRVEHAERRRIELEYGERDRNRSDDLLRNSRVVYGVRLAVVFLQDLIRVHCILIVHTASFTSFVYFLATITLHPIHPDYQNTPRYSGATNRSIFVPGAYIS